MTNGLVVGYTESHEHECLSLNVVQESLEWLEATSLTKQGRWIHY